MALIRIAVTWVRFILSASFIINCCCLPPGIPVSLMTANDDEAVRSADGRPSLLPCGMTAYAASFRRASCAAASSAYRPPVAWFVNMSCTTMNIERGRAVPFVVIFSTLSIDPTLLSAVSYRW